MAATSKWRERIKVHPAADAFPMMSDEELAELGEDIRKSGLKSSITLDVEGTLLDGRNRLEAIERAGIDLNKIGLGIDHQWMAHNYLGDPVSYIISANIRRRHLTKQQQADILVAIAKMTVGKKLVDDQPVSGGEMPDIPPEFDRRGGRGKKNPVKAEALKLNQALPKEQQVGMSTIKTALAKAEGKEPKTSEPKPRETYRAPLRRKPKLKTSSPLEAARHYYLEQCAAEAKLDIDAEIDIVTDALRELAGKHGSNGKLAVDTPLSNLPSTPRAGKKLH